MTMRQALRLTNVEPQLVALVTDVGMARDIIVLQGARTVAEELEAIASHHSALRDPMHSKHVISDTRPLAQAVDIGPWPLDWKDIASFQELGAFMKERALALHTPIQWGGEWVHLKDYVHYEMIEAI